MKPGTFTYVDSDLMDKEITCKFDVDYGYPQTRWEPGDPGGLYITEAIYDGKDIVDELSEKEIEALTKDAENKFYEEQASNEQDYGDWAADIARDNELMEKYK